MENLGELFSNSWKELKENFKSFLLILILLSFIPSLIFFVIEIFWLKDFLSLGFGSGLQPDSSQIIPLFTGPKFILLSLAFIAMIFIGNWLYTSLIYNSLYKKKKMSVGESLRGGKKYFWKFFGLMIIMLLVFSLPVFVLMGIIAGIVFLTQASGIGLIILFILLFSLILIGYFIFIIYLGVKWLFSPYALIGENKGIIDSLKESSKLVKGKWWRTFGYLILLVLIIIAISIVFSIPAMIINVILSIAYGVSGQANPLSSGFSDYFVITSIVSFIFNMLSQIIAVPFVVFFIKNFYLERKKGAKKEK